MTRAKTPTIARNIDTKTVLDRFGTRLEQRFSKDEIRRMMAAADLTDIAIREGEPYWVACGRRAKAATSRDR